MASDFQAAFSALREILRRHAAGMLVRADTATDFSVDTPAIGPNGNPIGFGYVGRKKSAVTYHLFPLYMNPALEATVPPELLAHKRGKTCFHFSRPDPDLFTKLDGLTGDARASFARGGFLSAGPVSAERMLAAFSAAGGDADALARVRKAKGKAAAAKRAATLRRQKGNRSAPTR